MANAQIGNFILEKESEENMANVKTQGTLLIFVNCLRISSPNGWSNSKRAHKAEL